MNCSECSAPLGVNVKFCPRCGAAAHRQQPLIATTAAEMEPSSQITCPACQNLCKPTAKFCPRCSQALNGQQEQASLDAEVSKVAPQSDGQPCVAQADPHAPAALPEAKVPTVVHSPATVHTNVAQPAEEASRADSANEKLGAAHPVHAVRTQTQSPFWQKLGLAFILLLLVLAIGTWYVMRDSQSRAFKPEPGVVNADGVSPSAPVNEPLEEILKKPEADNRQEIPSPSGEGADAGRPAAEEVNPEAQTKNPRAVPEAQKNTPPVAPRQSERTSIY